MAQEVYVPDLGNIAEAVVIELPVAEGQQVQKDATLLVLESDKAAMEIPIPAAGRIHKLFVKKGDAVKTGALIAALEVAAESAAEPTPSAPPSAAPPVSQPAQKAEIMEAIYVPDMGNIAEAVVIEVAIGEGQSVTSQQTLLVLESDKAAMEIPSPHTGVIRQLGIQKGDTVKTGALIAYVQRAEAGSGQPAAPAAPVSPPPSAGPAVAAPPTTAPQEKPLENTIDKPIDKPAGTLPYAGPAVRQLAHTLGVDLNAVTGTGNRGRITRTDVEQYVKSRMQVPRSEGIPLSLAPPDLDYRAWGTVTEQPLSRIKQRAARNLQQAWIQIPRVTHVDEADITELEAFRKSLAGKQPIKLSLLPFIMKAFAYTLKEYPQFNASLNPAMDTLILKHDVHLGVAVDTPQGLVVPVLRQVEKKGVLEIAESLDTLSQKARNGKLMPDDFQGATATISSLGGIGGTVFTPIVNLPNVAILGVCRSAIKPVFENGQFVPRLMLPVSLSYDHRAIDGAEAARFMVKLCQVLADLRQVLL